MFKSVLETKKDMVRLQMFAVFVYRILMLRRLITELDDDLSGKGSVYCRMKLIIPNPVFSSQMSAAASGFP